MVTSQTQCPRCTGMGGAHFAFCFLAQAWERFMGPNYPWRPNIEDEAAAEMARIERGPGSMASFLAETAPPDLPVRFSPVESETEELRSRLDDVVGEDVPVTHLPPDYYVKRKPERVELPTTPLTDVGEGFREWRRVRTISVSENDFTFGVDLYADYVEWCQTQGIKAMAMTGQQGFAVHFASVGYRSRKPLDRRDGKQRRAYYGVALRSALTAPPAPEQAPEPEQQTEATVTPEPKAAPAPTPPPAPEPLDVTWVNRTLAANKKTRTQLASAIGRSAPDVSNLLNGKRRFGPELQAKVVEWLKSLPVQVEATPEESLLVEPSPTGGRVPPEAADEILAWLAENTEAAPDDHWTLISTLTAEYLKTHDVHPMVAARWLGFVVNSLGYRKRIADKLPMDGTPANGEDPRVPRGRAMYFGLRLKQPAAKPVIGEGGETPAWMRNPEPKERPSVAHKGHVPGREIPKEYRDKIVQPLIEQGWTYYRNNTNGSGKPRVISPQGKTYALASTPSDVKGMRNAISHLRKLGADL